MMKLKKSKANGAVAGGVAIFDQKVDSPTSTSSMVTPTPSLLNGGGDMNNNGTSDGSNRHHDESAADVATVSTRASLENSRTKLDDTTGIQVVQPVASVDDFNSTTQNQSTDQDSSFMSESEQALLQSRIRDRKKSIMSGAAFRERRMTRMSVIENNDNNNN
nr:unnamed protein product [Naegleria fowleri]